MEKPFVRYLTALCFLAAPLLSFASSPDQSLVFDPQVFQEQRQALENEIRRSDRYAEIRRTERVRVFEALEEMSVLLSGVQSVEDLEMAERVEVFNLQEEINTILTRAHENSRLICERQTRTGSHLIRSQCQTVADRKATKERGQETLRDALHRPCANPQLCEHLRPRR